MLPASNKYAIDWLLRVAVALQCAGYAWWLGIVHESPLLGWLLSPTDVGGLALGEPRGLAVVNMLAAVLAISALWVLFRPVRPIVVSVFAFQVLFAVAEWRTHGGFPLYVAWLGTGWPRAIADAVVPYYPFAAGAARIAAPLTLLLVHWSSARRLLGISLSPASEWIIRIALAITFAAHGFEALQQHGAFLDMLITATAKLAGERMSQDTAEWLLVAIGSLDILVAVLVVTTRIRSVVWYMAAWGLITATARIIVWGFELGWYQTAIRSPHWALPLVLALAWQTANPPAANIHSTDLKKRATK